MPIIISFIATALINIVGSLLGRVLLGLGLGFVEYQGLQTLFSYVKAQILNLVSSGAGAYALLLDWAGFMHFDVIISIFLSAISVKMIFTGLMSDSVKKLVSK